MLTARLDGEPILISEPIWDGSVEMLRRASREGRLTAPCCGAHLTLRWGIRKVRHFAHAPRSLCPYQKWAEPESPEHLLGKTLLYDWCRAHFAGRIRFLALEHPIPETLQRPDVYLELMDGTRYALEYQRSAISLVQWQERHEAYQSLGVCDIWILGENRLAAAAPTSEQESRWAAQEPEMHFLNLRAFENGAALATPYERAWWRIQRQEELWEPNELDARTGRSLTPWYRRSALERLRSVTFLDANSGELIIYRGMRELRGHVDTRMASAVLRAPLVGGGLELTLHGFELPADRRQLERFEARSARLERAMAEQAERTRAGAGIVRESAAAWPRAAAAEPLPAAWPAYFHRRAEQRAAMLRQADPEVEAALFLAHQQEKVQRQLLQKRAEVPEWRRLVDWHGLRPDNLFFLVGVPILDDTIILVHRTVWQAYLGYLILGGRTASFTVKWAAGLLQRRFGLNREMVRTANYLLPGRVSSPEEVTGTFLNLLVACGYLRNDRGSELFRYHPVQQMPPVLAFADRQQRYEAWAGLLEGSLRLDGTYLVGAGGPGAGVRLPLVPAGR